MTLVDIRIEDVRNMLDGDMSISDAKLRIMIDDVVARAINIVPSLGHEVEPRQAAVAQAVLRKAIIRWIDSGSGGRTTHTQSAGPYSESMTYQNGGDRPIFYDSEIEELKALFPDIDGSSPKAASFDMAKTDMHSPYYMGWFA